MSFSWFLIKCHRECASKTTFSLEERAGVSLSVHLPQQITVFISRSDVSRRWWYSGNDKNHNLSPFKPKVVPRCQQSGMADAKLRPGMTRTRRRDRCSNRKYHPYIFTPAVAAAKHDRFTWWNPGNSPAMATHFWFFNRVLFEGKKIVWLGEKTWQSEFLSIRYLCERLFRYRRCKFHRILQGIQICINYAKKIPKLMSLLE